MQKASKSNNYHYNKKLKPFAQSNRRNLTKSASCLWKYVLSAKQCQGYQFRRERIIGNYIADFACLELLLVIEVDGISHITNEQKAKDIKKDEFLKSVGFEVLRLSSWEVLNKLPDVSELICSVVDGLESKTQSTPKPPQGG